MYDPLLSTTLDRIRLLVGDTSNDPATELFPDETYEATIALYPNWKRAAADMAEAVAVQLDRKVTGFTAVGDVQMSWTDQAKTLRAKATALRKEADIEDAASGDTTPPVVTIGADIFFGGGTGGDEWSAS